MFAFFSNICYVEKVRKLKELYKIMDLVSTKCYTCSLEVIVQHWVLIRVSYLSGTDTLGMEKYLGIGAHKKGCQMNQ